MSKISKNSILKQRKISLVITQSVDLQEVWEDVIANLKQEMVEFEVRGSGWSLTSVDMVEFRYAVYQPIRGSSYIPLPASIKSTKSVVNFHNKDKFCFKYTILSKHVQRIWSKKTFIPYLKLYNWDNLNWPLSVDDIKIFEKNNDVSIHVFFIDDDSYIKPYRLSKKEKENHFDLLLLMEQNKSHFAYIKNFNRLIARQLPMNYRKSTSKIRVCKRCLLPFLSDKSLTLHKCFNTKKQISMINKTIPTSLKLSKSLYIFEYSQNSFQNCILYGSKKCESDFTWKDIDENTSLSQINKFEKRNNVSINIFSVEKKNVVIIKSCKEEKKKSILIYF